MRTPLALILALGLCTEARAQIGITSQAAPPAVDLSPYEKTANLPTDVPANLPSTFTNVTMLGPSNTVNGSTITTAATLASSLGGYLSLAAAPSMIVSNSPVPSVAGRTGNVTLTHSDITDFAPAVTALLPNLSGYETTAALATTLAGYPTTTAMNSAVTAAAPNLSGYLTASAAASAYQPLGSYATTAQLTSATTGLLSATTAASTYQPIGSYATTAALSSLSASTVTSVAGVTPTAGNVPLAISNVGNVSGLAYFHRYSNVTLTVPSIGLGAIGTGTATVSGTAAGDQCFVAPTATTTSLGYVMASGWVTTAGTVKVTLAAGTLVAISAGSIAVNMLCAQ